ncbi:MAG: dockerin type I domain-containing protein, partial [Phycisphaerales bacterium]|nr:dockerin type I domain-containing protein [Phycisphaerales bacterium]
AEGMTWQGVASIDITNDDCMTPCLGDVDGDGSVNVVDLLAVISAWGPCEECDADIDANGLVDVTDLLTIISAWGPCS